MKKQKLIEISPANNPRYRELHKVECNYGTALFDTEVGKIYHVHYLPNTQGAHIYEEIMGVSHLIGEQYNTNDNDDEFMELLKDLHGRYLATGFTLETLP